MKSTVLWLSLGLFALPASVGAQSGTISGRVVDGGTGEPLANATVRALLPNDTEAAGELTDPDGRFELEVPPGSYVVAVDLLGYRAGRVEGVTVAGGATDTVSVALAPEPVALNPIVVTASRGPEKALDAPATVAVVEAEEIERRPAPNPAEHVKDAIGVDFAQSGVQQANVVTRGFNNLTTGALLVLQDYRDTHLPSTGVNLLNTIPVTNLDLDRIEVVLGPEAALYGAGAGRGVLHLITTSPIDDPGTRFRVTGGERSLFHGEFRHAAPLGKRSAIRISGQVFRADDFEEFDPVEVAAREAALATDPSTRIGLRDFDIFRGAGEVRFDTRPWDDGEVVASAGVSLTDEMLASGPGAFQAEGFRRTHAQIRFRKGRLFAQAFGNVSDSGDTFQLRTGEDIVEDSVYLAAQTQHGVALGEREDLVYGIDVERTVPRTDGTFNGRFEEDDAIDLVGGFVHSETRLTDRLELVAAARVDWHNRLPDPVFSPQVALVFGPAPDHNLRATFNRAFDPPGTLNLFIDLPLGEIPLGPGIGYTIRALGTGETGFSFDARCPGGALEGLCMRSPFAPAERLPADAAVLFDALVERLAPPELQPLVPLLQEGAATVGTILRRLNPQEGKFVEAPGGPIPVGPPKSRIFQTFELGYKGLLGDRLLVIGDVYYSEQLNPSSALQVVTATVFLDPVSTAGFIRERLSPLVETGDLTSDELAEIVEQLSGGLAQVPIGTVAPDQNENSDILLAFRDVEEQEIDLWGLDLALELLLSDRWTLAGTYSYVSDGCFSFVGGNACADPLDVPLNAPQSKGSFRIAYDPGKPGLDFESRARFVDGFPAASGVFFGRVPGYSVVDMTAGYRFPGAPLTRAFVTALNLFDNEHREMVGAAEIGRVVVAGLQVEL